MLLKMRLTLLLILTFTAYGYAIPDENDGDSKDAKPAHHHHHSASDHVEPDSMDAKAIIPPIDLSKFNQVEEFEKVEDKKPPPDPPPESAILCHKPDFYDLYKCSSPDSVQPMGKVADLISLDITKMPFNKNQWMHLDVIPSVAAQVKKEYLSIKHAYVQFSDTKYRVVGRVAERVPCIRNNHPMFHFDREKSVSEPIAELYENPGVKNIHIFECSTTPEFNKAFNPTVVVLNFDPPVIAFYVNYKFTKDEVDFIQNQEVTERMMVDTLLVDENGACYFHRVDQLDGLPPFLSETNISAEVPIDCHGGGPAVVDKNKKFYPLDMDKDSTVNVKHIEFDGSVGPRPRSNMVFIAKHEWRTMIDWHNKKQHGVDPLGYAPGERELEKAMKRPKQSDLRRPYLPLIEVPAEEPAQPSAEFEPDDDDCDDSKRTVHLENPRDELAKLYFSCNFSARCIGDPEGCIKEKNCELIVGWNKVGDYVKFELAAYSVKFATVTLSKDDKLGDDSITECVREKDEVTGYTSTNYFDQDDGIVYTTRRRSCAPMVDFKGGMVDTYTFMCTWKRPLVTRVKGVFYKLNSPHYVILTAGYESSLGVLGSIGKNDFVEPSEEAVILDVYIGKNPFQQWVAHIHALCMVVVWMFLVPIGTFVSRYMKGTYVKVRILNKYSFWFGVHFISSIATVVVTVSSVAFMVITSNHWYTDLVVRHEDWHDITGFIITALLVVQLIFAYLMLKKNKWKWLEMVNFKICHAVTGHVIQYTGYACVWLSRYVREGFHCDSTTQLGWFTGCFILFHAIMSYQVCYSDFVTGRRVSRIYRIFLIDHHQNRRVSDEAAMSLEDLPEEEEPGSFFRKPVFFAFVGVLAGFNVYFMFLMWQEGARDCLTIKSLKPITTKYEQGKLYD